MSLGISTDNIPCLFRARKSGSRKVKVRRLGVNKKLVLVYRAVGWFDMISTKVFLLIFVQCLKDPFQVLSPSTSGGQALWCEMPTKSGCSLMMNFGWKSLWKRIKFALVALSWKHLLITLMLVACWDQCFPLFWVNWWGDLDWLCDNYWL